MIFDPFGNAIRITARAGLHALPGRAARVLVQTRDLAPDGIDWYFFADVLRADGGRAEVDQAIDSAPSVTLEGAPLRRALAMAE
jgi:hypothetical protein